MDLIIRSERNVTNKPLTAKETTTTVSAMPRVSDLATGKLQLDGPAFTTEVVILIRRVGSLTHNGASFDAFSLTQNRIGFLIE